MNALPGNSITDNTDNVRLCLGCGQPLAADAHWNRERCDTCAQKHNQELALIYRQTHKRKPEDPAKRRARYLAIKGDPDALEKHRAYSRRYTALKTAIRRRLHLCTACGLPVDHARESPNTECTRCNTKLGDFSLKHVEIVFQMRGGVLEFPCDRPIGDVYANDYLPPAADLLDDWRSEAVIEGCHRDSWLCWEGLPVYKEEHGL